MERKREARSTASGPSSSTEPTTAFLRGLSATRISVGHVVRNSGDGTRSSPFPLTSSHNPQTQSRRVSFSFPFSSSLRPQKYNNMHSPRATRILRLQRRKASVLPPRDNPRSAKWNFKEAAVVSSSLSRKIGRLRICGKLLLALAS